MAGTRSWKVRADERYRGIAASVIWQLLGRQKRWLGALMGLALCSFAVAVGTAVTVQDAVDFALVAKVEPLDRYTESLLGLAFLGLLFGFPFRQVTARLGFHLEYELRVWVYERLHAMHPNVLDALASGQAMTRAMSDLTMLELATLLVPTLAVGVVLLLALAAVMLYQDPLLGTLALLSMPLNLWAVPRIRKPLFGMAYTILNRLAEVTTAIDEAVRGARVVKAFAREDDERVRVRDAAAGAYRATLNRVRFNARYELFLRAAPIVVDALLVGLGARRVQTGDFTIGQLLIFLVYSGVFTGLARSFEEIVSVWQLARSGARRIFELISMAPAAPPAAPAPGPDDPVVLTGTGFSLEVQRGELVVLDGPLPADGFGGPGVLALDDQPFLFGTSVADNLRLAAPTATDAELQEALVAAAVDDVVAGLGGLDGHVGDRGLTLSGGQRQRFALARALLHRPPVLLLRDALAAVNPSLEVEILRRVRALRPELAIVAVTTRPLVAAAADRVVPTGLEPAAPGQAGNLFLEALTSARPEDLLPPELVEALGHVPPETESPTLSETDATWDEEPPRVRNLLRPMAKAAAVAGGLLFVTTVIGLIPPGLVRLAVDDLRDDRSTTQAIRSAILIALCGVAVGGFTYLYKIRAARVSEGAMYLLRRRTFQRLTRLGVDFYDRELPGRVAARVVHDLDKIAAFVETGIYQAGTAIILVASTIVVMWLWSPEVTSVVLAFIPPLVLITVIEVPLANRAYERARARLGTVIARLQEDLAGRYVITGLGAQHQARERFAADAWALRQARRRSTAISNLHGELVAYLVALATALVLAKAGELVVHDELSLGGAIMLQLYLVLAFAPIPQLSNVLQSYLAARASFRTLGEPFLAPIIPVPPGAGDPVPADCPPLGGRLAFDGISFAYPGTAATVLHGIDLTIEPGGIVALVGPTGAGKSTVAKLLGRVYDPVEGQVRCDDVDIRSHAIGSYRRRLGIVPQDGFCFRGTLAANLAYGRPTASREEVEAAVEAVGAWPAVHAVPGGFDGWVDEEGRNLSAADRQLVAIARAWLVDPDVLVLDEATSALDLAAEHHVLEAVAARGRTTVFVTHRPAVAARADLVVVVDGGRIVATGRHADLLAEGWYRSLWPDGSGGGAADAEVALDRSPAPRRRREPLRVAGDPT